MSWRNLTFMEALKVAGKESTQCNWVGTMINAILHCFLRIFSMENRKEFRLSSLSSLYGGRGMGISAGSLERREVALCRWLLFHRRQGQTALPPTSPPWADLEAPQGPLQTVVWANYLSFDLIKPTNAIPLGTSSQAWSFHKATLVLAGMAAP